MTTEATPDQQRQRLCDHINGMDYVQACGWCEGEGQYKQTYNAGCGQGYFDMMGPCGQCDGLGIRMVDRRPVPSSVIAQINAAIASIEP